MNPIQFYQKNSSLQIKENAFQEKKNENPNNYSDFSKNEKKSELKLNDIKFTHKAEIPVPLKIQNGVIGSMIRRVFTFFGMQEDIGKTVNQYINSRETLKQEHEAYIALGKKSLQAPSGVEEKRDSTMPLLPQDYDIDTARKNHARKSYINKTEASRAHIKTGTAKENLQPIRSGDGNSWMALNITKGKEGEFTVKKESVCTTAERALGISSDLNNLYVHTGSSGQITVSCGIIDTKDKADEFIEAVVFALKNYPDNLPKAKLRLTMHQLNAFGSERKLIQNQHRMAAYINGKIKERVEKENIAALKTSKGPFVAHINRCLNGFSSFPGEEAKSKSNNLQALGIQAGWIYEDFKDADLKEANELKKALKTATKTSHRILEMESAAENSGKYTEHASLQSKLKKDLTSLAVDSKKFLDNAKLSNKKLHPALNLFTQILAEQTDVAESLGYPKLSASQKLALEMLMDQTLGCMTEINCKSGLDRTGFARALQNSLQQKIEEKTKEWKGKREAAIESVVDFINIFEQETLKMDKRRRKGEETSDFKEVQEFQAKIFDELVKVAIPMTGRSTGLLGLKWHHDKKSFNPFEKNMHPIPYLPYKVKDSKTGKEIEILGLSSAGARSLSKDGQATLMGLSQRRGA